MMRPFTLSTFSRWRTLGSFVVLLSALTLSVSAAFEKSAQDYFVHSLPGANPSDPVIKMHAGHIEITPEHHGNLFFWQFENKHLADRPRLVIWLNGGPGCSSEDGALMEIGPYRVREGGNLEQIDGAWNEFATLLFVDNPVGTGYSYVDTDSFVRELTDMANQFVQFLEKWFDIFPEYSHDDIYFAGESYAGQHIPHIAKAILDRNSQKRSDDQWNLKGLLIGNGWISGPDQYPSYLQYAYHHGLIKEGSSEAQQLEARQATCNQKLAAGGSSHVDVPECEAILSEILLLSSIMEGGERMCYNMYDVRLRDKHPSCGMAWPPDLDHVTPYLRQNNVIEALHVNKDKKTGWTECNGAVGSAFRARNSVPSVKLLPELLEHVPIVLFSGDQDLICNHLGTEELIHNLEWNGGKGFETSPGVWAPRKAWTFDGEPAGFYQEARNLTYILFYNASHMVPFDEPRKSRDMIDRFMGVDIAEIGGRPIKSTIGGEEAGPQTSVGGTPNSTLALQEQGEKIKDAEWKAYRKSGEVALLVVAIAAAAWGVFVCRGRRNRRDGGFLSGIASTAGYKGVFTSDPDDVDEGRGFRRTNGDLEAADFDENELDDLSASDDGTGNGKGKERAITDSFGIGDEDDGEDEKRS